MQSRAKRTGHILTGRRYRSTLNSSILCPTQNRGSGNISRDAEVNCTVNCFLQVVPTLCYAKVRQSNQSPRRFQAETMFQVESVVLFVPAATSTGDAPGCFPETSAHSLFIDQDRGRE